MTETTIEEKKRPTERMTGKKRRKFIAALAKLSEHLGRWVAEAESAGRTGAAQVSREQLAAIEWARDLVEHHSWQAVQADQPQPGEAVIVLSDVAGAAVAVRIADRFMCTCGCEQTVPGRVVSWTSILPRHLPSERD